MPERGARPCRAMWLWSAGGYLLGLMTALMGRNMVMVCTEAVEEAVHQHMDEQIAFLRSRDEKLKVLIEEIQVEERMHLDFARQRAKHDGFTKFISSLVGLSTELGYLAFHPGGFNAPAE